MSVAPEMPLPESVAEYCDRIAARAILGGCEGSPFDDGRTQETEEFRADVPGRNLLGFCAIREVQLPNLAAETSSNTRVRSFHRLNFDGDIRGHPSPVECVPQDNEPVGVRCGAGLRGTA